MPDVQDFSVEESRAKRVERLQSKYRNRGGVFKPATHNALLDVLLSRGVDGESPSKRRKSRKSFAPPPKNSEAPKIERRKSLAASAAQEKVDKEPAPPAAAKGKAKAASSRRKSQAPTKRKSIAGKAKVQNAIDSEVEDAEPVAGPSRTTKPSAKVAKRKAKEDSEAEEQEDPPPPKKAAKRAPARRAAKTTKTTKKAQQAEDEVIDSVPPPKRASNKRSRRQPEPTEEDSDDEPIVPPKRAKAVASDNFATKSSAQKAPLETIGEDSDSEDDVPLYQVMKMAKAKAAKNADVTAEAKFTAKVPSKPVRSAPTSDVQEAVRVTIDKPPNTSKRSKAKAIEHEEHDTEDVQPIASSSRTVKGSTKPNVSKRKVPALPEPFVDSDMDELPSKTKAVKTSLDRTEDVSQSASKTDGRRDASTLNKPQPSRKDRKAVSSARKEAAEPEQVQEKPIGTSRKRERDKPATVAPPEDEPDEDEQPPPPRKRTKRSAKLNSEALADVPISVQERVDHPGPIQEEELSAKPKFKSTSRAKKAPSSQASAEPKQRGKTLKENFPSASRNAIPKAGIKYKPKPKPRLSMFPPPVLVADSDDDPIDFLS